MEVLEHTDILFVNGLEAAQLTKLQDLNEALTALGRFIPTVVVKFGTKGAVAIKNREIVLVPGFKVEAVDTTGAGDSFAAGFVHGFLQGQTLLECLKLANACGALSTLTAGGTANQPDRATLGNFLNSAVEA
jgi:sugar/nucleoside kinase (ribokinase family)